MLGGSWTLRLQLHRISRRTYVKVRKNIDVSAARIWRKQRPGRGKGWTDGRQKNSEQGGKRGKAFLADASPFPCLGEAVHQWGAWVPADGSCDTGDGVCQVSGSKIKTVWIKGEKTATFLSLQSVSVCAAVSLLQKGFQTADLMGRPGAMWLWGLCDAPLSGFNRGQEEIATTSS